MVDFKNDYYHTNELRNIPYNKIQFIKYFNTK
jgi:hypothetical protein